MTALINVWPIEQGTIELSRSQDSGKETWWVDHRDVWGDLVGAEPFDCQDRAREHALNVVYGGPKNF